MPAPPIQYGWLPPAQTVRVNSSMWNVPSGYIHQAAHAQGGGPDIQGVYAYPNSGWRSIIWRWADTMRHTSIQRVMRGGKPAYRVESTPTDKASPGTFGNSPR